MKEVLIVKRAKRNLIGAAIAVIACTAIVLASEDIKRYPGASCQPASNGDAIARPSGGGMFNASTATQFWTCPIVLANNTNDRSTIEFAGVTVVDNHATQNVNCTLVSRNITGQHWNSAAGEQQTEPPTGNKLITFGAGDANAVELVPSGYAYLRCSVPASVDGVRSGIVMYTVTENVGEN